MIENKRCIYWVINRYTSIFFNYYQTYSSQVFKLIFFFCMTSAICIMNCIIYSCGTYIRGRYNSFYHKFKPMISLYLHAFDTKRWSVENINLIVKKLVSWILHANELKNHFLCYFRMVEWFTHPSPKTSFTPSLFVFHNAEIRQYETGECKSFIFVSVLTSGYLLKHHRSGPLCRWT